jgi:hypothetical protein
MLDVLNKHLENVPTGCAAARWINTLSKDEQKVFELIKEKSSTIKVAQLYADLSKDLDLPFKLTAFRSHLRGYCTCR